MIIDSTDFTDRIYKVPNQEESRDFVSFIEDAEDKIAVEFILGKTLWDEFQAALEGSGELEERWINLRDGVTYTRNNKVYQYRGWVDMIRPAIYSLWVPVGTKKFTNVGFIKNTPQQAKLIDDDYPEIVDYWNKFAHKVGYRTECGYNCVNTFYGFMKSNEGDYDNWVFNCPEFKNRHDL